MLPKHSFTAPLFHKFKLNLPSMFSLIKASDIRMESTCNDNKMSTKTLKFKFIQSFSAYERIPT